MGTLGQMPVDGSYRQCNFGILVVLIGVLVYAFIVGTAAGLLSEVRSQRVRDRLSDRLTFRQTLSDRHSQTDRRPPASSRT
jgi:hypothetical protein